MRDGSKCIACGAPSEKLLVTSSGEKNADGAKVYDIALDFCDYCAQDEGVVILYIEREKDRMTGREAQRKQLANWNAAADGMAPLYPDEY